MKFLKTVGLFASIIASACANNVMTFYGCAAGECSAQAKPSCSAYSHKSASELPSHFCALSTKLDNYDSYCGKYVVFMKSDGTNVKKLGKATVIDSCSSCPEYHVDLSLDAFTDLAERKDGVGNIIWGVFDKSGSKIAGPYYNSVSGSAEKLGLSKDAFISAFVANAKSLASSSSSTRSFSASGVSVSDDDEKKTTTRKSTTTSTRKSTTSIPAAKATTPAVKTVATKSLPVNTLSTKMATATKGLVGVKSTVAAPKAVATTAAKAPAGQSAPQVTQVDQVTDEEEGSNGVGAVLAIGGGVIGAAGAGLLFMKKKNPNTYEGMKQKFPEAFSNVKRGLSRSATSIKRKVTRKAPTNDVSGAVTYV